NRPLRPCFPPVPFPVRDGNIDPLPMPAFFNSSRSRSRCNGIATALLVLLGVKKITFLRQSIAFHRIVATSPSTHWCHARGRSRRSGNSWSRCRTRSRRYPRSSSNSWSRCRARSRCSGNSWSRYRTTRRSGRNWRCDNWSGARRRSTGRSRTNSNDRSCFLPSLIWFFLITDKKRCTRYRRDSHFSRTCNDHLVTDFREILRINARAKIDSSRGKNIRGPATITAQRDTDDAAVGTSFLSKICDLKEAIVRDWDCERRSCNDFALESDRKNKARI